MSEKEQMPKPTRFDPRNEKYKDAKLSDLPRIMRDDYREAKGGGFISAETEAEYAEMEQLAKGINSHRTLKEKFLGQNKRTAIGLQHEIALAMNEGEDEYEDKEKNDESFSEEKDKSGKKDEESLNLIRERLRSGGGMFRK